MKLKLRYLSDLHLEFMEKSSITKLINSLRPNNNDEICILAGDIDNPYSSSYMEFIDSINTNFTKTFIIPGNHEYYQHGKSVEETNNYLNDFFKSYNNVTFLNNTYENYKEYCFVGTTLWTKITKPEYSINDIHYIKDFDYLKCNQLNMLAIDFLEETVSKNNKCIIITHHLPSNDLIDIKYKTARMRPYNQWFYCDMEPFIDTYKANISCWIYGHTHTSSIKNIHNIPFICNPLGYPGENTNIDINKIFEI